MIGLVTIYCCGKGCLKRKLAIYLNLLCFEFWIISEWKLYWLHQNTPSETGDAKWATYFLSPHQEIDGKSLLLMQRSDVLTGLSIRLGPALKIYERHVKVLQRTHFLEYEDLWSHDSHDRQTHRQYTALTWTCMQCPLPSGPCHPPSYTEYRGWVWGKAAVELTFTVSMTRNWKTVILPLIMVFGFHFTHVAIRLHCQGNRPLCSEYALKWRTSNLSARVKDG